MMGKENMASCVGRRGGFGFRFILSSGLALVGTWAQATVLSAPAITDGSTAFSGAYQQGYAFDGTANTFASAGAGDSTFLQFDFGSNIRFDRVVMLNRQSAVGGDRFSQVTLSYQDAGLQPLGSDTIAVGTTSEKSGIYALANGPVTTQLVRWDIDARNGTAAANPGMAEMFFLDTPDGARIHDGVTVYNGATAFAGYDVSSAADGRVGFSVLDGLADYASQGQGADMFLDFDLGAETEVVGFDLIDRLFATDNIVKFDLIFSNDSGFGSVVDTLSFDKGTAAATSGDFSAISARYVRLDATEVYGGTGATYNSGVNEMVFYSIPEPSTALLFGISGFGAFLFRRLRL